MVHVTGSARVIEEQTDQDRTRIMSMLRDLVGENEAQFSRPWRMELPADYMRKMIDGIVAFEIDIARITGKFKLSQNRPAADRLNVIAALEQSGADEARAVAHLMKEIFQAPDE